VTAKEYGYEEQLDAGWDLALTVRSTEHRYESLGMGTAYDNGLFDGRRQMEAQFCGYGKAGMAAGQALAAVHAPHIIARPALRCGDPHVTSVMIAASCGKWITRAELWQAVQAIEPMTLGQVDKYRKALQVSGRIVTTRIGNGSYYVGNVAVAQDA
jgi:hypothetical protein